MKSNFAGKTDSARFDVDLPIIKSTDCAGLIETSLKSDQGILGYHIDKLNKIADMFFDKTKMSRENIEKLISNAGFDANSTKANSDEVNKLPVDYR